MDIRYNLTTAFDRDLYIFKHTILIKCIHEYNGASAAEQVVGGITVTFKLDVRYIVAHRTHLSIIRHTERGLFIEPLSKRLSDFRSDCYIPRSTAQYAACEDEQGDVHIIYLDDSDALMHAIIRQPHAEVSIHALAAEEQAPFNRKQLREMKLHCIHNTLQLFLLIDDQLIYYQLAGLHWSAPVIFLNESRIHAVQLLQSNSQSLFLVITETQQTITILTWRYNLQDYAWKPTSLSAPTIQINDHLPLYVHSYIDISDTVHLITLQFPRSKLSLTRYILGREDSRKPVHESITLTPIRNVQAAVLDADHTDVHISWLADGIIYRLNYHQPRAAWSSLQAIQTTEPALWNVLSHDHSLSLPYPHWLSSTRDWKLLNEQLGSMIDLYYTQRSFQVSVTYAEASLSSIERMLEEKVRMASEVDLLEGQLQLWREQSHMKKQRIAILNEELAIRDKLSPFIAERKNVHEEERVVATLHSVVTEQNRLSRPIPPVTSSKIVVKPSQEHVQVDSISTSTSISESHQQEIDSMIAPPSTGVRNKVISLLQRLQKNRP